MCIEFRLEATYKDVAEYFEMNLETELPDWKGTLFPNYPALVILPERTPAVMTWGFKHPTLKKYVQNCRSETVDTSPMFRGQFKRTRCLLPATSYVERKNRITMDSNLFAFAGLYNSAGQCTMLTTSPNPFMEPIHDRMPVILNRKDYDRWLTEGGKELLIPYVGELKAVSLVKPKAVKQQELF